MELLAIALNKDGSIHSRVDPRNDRPQSNSKVFNKTIRYKKNIRDTTKKVSDDEAILVDLNKLPANIWSVLFFLKLPNLVNFLIWVNWFFIDWFFFEELIRLVEGKWFFEV